MTPPSRCEEGALLCLEVALVVLPLMRLRVRAGFKAAFPLAVSGKPKPFARVSPSGVTAGRGDSPYWYFTCYTCGGGLPPPSPTRGPWHYFRQGASSTRGIFQLQWSSPPPLGGFARRWYIPTEPPKGSDTLNIEKPNPRTEIIFSKCSGPS